MNILDLPIPNVYKQSSDFRFFLKWFDLCLSKVQQDTENGMDLYDPLRCPSDLLWMLADTMGFKFDDRLCTAFNRLVLMYFASMIHNRGSEFGIVLAAETNLAQFIVENDAKNHEEATGDNILYERLESTALPVNSAYVTNHVEEGYIDVVYFSSKIPVDTCLEYVRPAGMYCFQSAGVRFDSKTKISIDPSLVHYMNDMYTPQYYSGNNRVADYTREDYASLERGQGRQPAYKSNSVYEVTPDQDAGKRALYSLQLCNGGKVVNEVLDPERKYEMFTMGMDPDSGDIEINTHGESVSVSVISDNNLVYDKNKDLRSVAETGTVLDPSLGDAGEPYRPRVGPNMGSIGQAIFNSASNERYINKKQDGTFEEKQSSDDFSTNT